MSLRCRLGLHEHGKYTPDRSYEPVVYLERCPRCGRVLSTEPPTRGFYYHESLVAGRTTCPSAIDAGDGIGMVCPGHVIGEDGKPVATMRPLTLQRAAEESARRRHTKEGRGE